MALEFIIGIVIVSLVFTIFVLQAFLKARRKLELQLRRRLGDCQLKVSEYKKRLALVEPYASDYMNSLRPETTRALLQLRRLMMAHQRMLEQLHSLLLSGDYEKYPEALAVIDKMLSHPAGPALTGPATRSTELLATGDDIIPTIPKNWEIQAESLLQQVGQEVYRASQRATEIGLPKNRRRKPTIYSLSSAGIIRPGGKGPVQ